MALTNILVAPVCDRRATVYYLADALGASVTTTVKGPATATFLWTAAEQLGAQARGKIIPVAYCKKDSGSSANIAVKLQHAIPVANVAEASWDWEDLCTFTALTTDVATFEEVEITKAVRPCIRAVITRTGGTVTGLRIGYRYQQCGPRASLLNRGAFASTVE